MASTPPRFPRVLRLVALSTLVATGATWLATGAHWGWTRTSVTEMRHDDITGIDYPVTHPQFVAGVEVLAVGTGLALGLFAAALLVGRRQSAGS